MEMKKVLALLFVLLSALAGACLWDSDTLAEEMKGRLDTVDAIVGRIRRYPPIYYEKRIEINTPLAAKGDFGAYDNIAVAYSRLGDQDKAIEWIQKKRPLTRVTRAMVNPTSKKEIQYRTESNEGTFWLIKWLAAKPAERKPEWLGKSQKMIAAALKIDANAHFGRERVQLKMIEWLIEQSNVAKGQESPLNVFMGENSEFVTEDVRRGLVGLMVLGAAWESIDVIAAVGSSHDESSITHLANIRIKGLREAGSSDIFGRDVNAISYAEQEADIEENTTKNHALLREDAKAFQKQFSDFVQSQVKKGLHPDKDGDAFWEGWKEPERVILIQGPVRPGSREDNTALWMSLGIGAVAILTFGITVWVGSRLRRRPLP